MTETEPDYLNLPVREADRLIKDRMEYHRTQMKLWALRRGQRLQMELDAGRKPAEVAVEIDASVQVVYDLTRQARNAQKAAEQH